MQARRFVTSLRYFLTPSRYVSTSTRPLVTSTQYFNVEAARIEQFPLDAHFCCQHFVYLARVTRLCAMHSASFLMPYVNRNSHGALRRPVKSECDRTHSSKHRQ